MGKSGKKAGRAAKKVGMKRLLNSVEHPYLLHAFVLLEFRTAGRGEARRGEGNEGSGQERRRGRAK